MESLYSFDREVAEDRVVLRPSLLRRWIAVPMVGFGGLCWVLAFRDPSMSMGGLAFLAVWSAGVLVGSLSGFTSRVILDARGVTARCFRTRELRWDQVDAVDVSRATRFHARLGGRGLVKPVLVTVSGDRFRLPITTGLSREGEQNDDARYLNRLITTSAERFGGRTVTVATVRWQQPSGWP